MTGKKLNHVKVPDLVINTSLMRKRRKEVESITIFDSNGTVINKKNVYSNNIHNFDEAGNEYLCGFVELMCTHYPNEIIKPKDDDPLFDYYMIASDFELFKEEATAGLPEQKGRLVKQVYNIFSNPRPCYIPKSDGSGYKAMPPFIIGLETAGKRSLSVADIKRLEHLQSESSPSSKNKIDIIKIYFVKDLFQDFLEDRGRWHFLANGFYP
jgi:hypothetical protein